MEPVDTSHVEPVEEQTFTIAVGDGVIYQDTDGSERKALVQHVHSDDLLNLVYVDERGRVVNVTSAEPSYVSPDGYAGWRADDGSELAQAREPEAASDGADTDGVAAEEAAGDATVTDETQGEPQGDPTDASAAATGDAPQVEGEPQAEPDVAAEPQPEQPPSY